MITITARDAGGAVLARACHDTEALLCFDRDYAEGDTIEINVIGKQPIKEEPHTIFERLRKNSKRKSDMKKAVKSGSSHEDDTMEKSVETPD